MGSGRGSAMLERRIRARRSMLPADGEVGFISACCKLGQHRRGCTQCASLKCTCECHNRCLPIGDDQRCKKVGA